MKRSSYPWDDIQSSRGNERLQKKHSPVDARKKYLEQASSCPSCRCPAEQLIWFYFQSPASTWQHLCGVAGWMTVCDKCQDQVDFFTEIMC